MTHSRPLLDQLSARVKHGDHLCLVCEDPLQRLEAAAQYVSDGLKNNEFVMYAADAASTQALRTALEQRGIDVEAALARGALHLPYTDDAYLKDGACNPDHVYESFERAIRTALEAGFSGCRFAGEPVWAIDRKDLRPGLIEFETRLNGLFADQPAAGLCVYDKNAWPDEVVREVLLTHPVAVVDDALCDRNIFYERPDLVDPRASPKVQVQSMLAQLREHRTEEARLQIALEAGRLGSWELELATDTSVRSLRHDQIFGYERLQPHWGYELFMQHVLAEDRESVDHAFRSALAQGSTWHFECRIKRHGDGVVRWIEANGRPYPEGARGNRVQRLLGIVTDITERKELEHALREADRRKDEFLATLAHELRNPLAPILNALQLLQLKGAPDAQSKRAQDIIERQTRHLARLVDDLLEVSRIASGRITLQRERVELGSVLTSAVEVSQPLIAASGHSFTISLPPEPVWLEGDATRLAQVFLNLLNNAAKYTPAGGRIELTAQRHGMQVEVQVKDNGLGIAAGMEEQIFRMFVQGHSSAEQAHSGLGVGLPLARQLLDMHGGSVVATSAGIGQGSCFTVRLPVLSEARDKPADMPASASTATIRMHVLLVDDNVDAAYSLAANLELAGHAVRICHDGNTALAAAQECAPDVAVLDIGMPGMNGYELARQLRSTIPALKLVALTGWGQEKDKQLALQAGFDLHRTKPVDPLDLMAVVAQVPPGRRP